MRTSHRVRSGSASLAVESVGNGPPVIFLHANVADSRMWHAQMDSIGTDNMAIAYDRRGFRSEEHTSELQSHHELVCRPLLEKKNK